MNGDGGRKKERNYVMVVREGGGGLQWVAASGCLDLGFGCLE